MINVQIQNHLLEMYECMFLTLTLVMYGTWRCILGNIICDVNGRTFFECILQTVNHKNLTFVPPFIALRKICKFGFVLNVTNKTTLYTRSDVFSYVCWFRVFHLNIRMLLTCKLATTTAARKKLCRSTCF